MKVKELMTKNVEVVQADATVQEAASKMREINVGALPVVNGKEVLGMVTDRDIVTRSTAMGRDPGNTRVKDVMTNQFFSCHEDADIKEAAKIMSDRQIRRLAVVDQENHLVGIVSLGDFSVDTDETKVSGKILEDVSRPARPDR